VAIKIKMVISRFEPADDDDDVAAVLREEIRVVHRVTRGVAPYAGGVGDRDGGFGVAAVGELEIGQNSICDQRHAGNELRVVVAIKVPEIVGRLAGGGETCLRTAVAGAEVHVQQNLRAER
jgi:hypothetical protein